MSPVTLLLKAFMQSTWEQGLGWDEPLPKDTRDEFIEWRKHLVDLRKIRIPRCLLPKGTLKSVQFHVYCDASERGYGACIYIRAVNSEGTVSTRLIMAKAKVSPVKQISIPRLELLAATIGVKLVQIVTTAFDNAQCPFNEIFAYSDSTTVLAWLSRNSRVWVTFVSNRVSAILEVVQRSSWYHIPSEQNPADLLSRGCHPGELVGNNKWWYGPDAIQQKNFTIPNQDHLLPVDTSTDMKKETSHCFFANQVDPESAPQFQDLKQTSNFEKTVRVTSYMIRFLSRMKRYSSQSTASNRNTMLCEFNKKFSACAQNHRYVTPQEATFVRNLFIQREQQLYLADEIIALNAGKELHRSSKLFDLYPFMDEGIMRVGGRLAASNSLSDDQKFPIIVPHDSPLGWLLIDHAHRVLFHGTQQGCLAVIRAKYWLVKANPKIRKYIHDCTRCHRYVTSASVPLMGDLPQERVTECKPWDHTGVDFAGPFNVRVYSDPPRSILPKKARSTRGTAQGAKPIRVCSSGKAYMAIFVCFASKAVHIEAVGDLSTASCLAAFNRFVARRRKPRRMYSDNGTNFVGSRNEIDALQAALAKKAANSLPSHSAATGIDWVHIPPRAPHFGGLWEAAVKSAKLHLKKVLGANVLTFEELSTVFCQVEAIMNSRPLVQLTPDDTDYTALTPAMLLTGADHDHLPLEPQNDVPQSPRAIPLHDYPQRRWKYMARLTAHWWSRWIAEYLPTLQKRAKWQSENPGKWAVGDLVLVAEDNLPPLPLAACSIDCSSYGE